MDDKDDIERGVDLALKLQAVINETAAADAALTSTHTMRALSMCAAQGLVVVQTDIVLFPDHVERPLKIFQYYILESLRHSYPNRISPELNQHIDELQQQLSRPASGH